MSHAVAAPIVHASPRTRAAGVAIALATVVSTVFVALDHGGGGTTPREILQGILALTALKELVHGVAIASVCAYAFGYTVLARRLGLHRPLVLAGLVPYLIGCVAMVGATILDGFVTPHLATDALAGSPERIAFAYQAIHAVGVVLNDLAKLGWVLQALGAMAWSVVLLHEPRLPRMAGVVGLVSSVGVVALVLMSATNMTMASLLGVLLAQLLWNVAAATWLIREGGRIVPPIARAAGVAA